MGVETYYEEVERLQKARETEELQALVEQKVAELVSDGEDIDSYYVGNTGNLIWNDSGGGRHYTWL